VKADRLARVNRLIQTTLAELLRQVKDPRVTAATVLTVTAVRTSADLRHAKVYLAVSGTAEEQQAVVQGLERAQGFLRGELSRSIRLRYSPELHFLVDETIESAARIDRILRELASEGGTGEHPDARTIHQAQASDLGPAAAGAETHADEGIPPGRSRDPGASGAE
jgi:ribosome-binding factor A